MIEEEEPVKRKRREMSLFLVAQFCQLRKLHNSQKNHIFFRNIRNLERQNVFFSRSRQFSLAGHRN